MEHLQKYISYINGLAYRDALTGVKNKTAYQDTESRFEEEMRQGKPEFAVVVLDINGLKKVNDTYGHDFGDMLIISACRLICKTFQHSPVYRIGGDEFVVILEKSDFDHYPELLEKLQKEIDGYNRNARADTQVSIARGIAIYNSETDLVFANVFKRIIHIIHRIFCPSLPFSKKAVSSGWKFCKRPSTCTRSQKGPEETAKVPSVSTGRGFP